MLTTGGLRAISSILSPWVPGVFLFLLAAGQIAGVLPVRVTLLASGILFGLFAWRAIPLLHTTAQRMLLFGLFAVSLLLQALPEFPSLSRVSLYEFGWRASLVMCGWSFVLSLLALPAQPEPNLADAPWARRCFPLLLAGTFCELVGTHFAIRGRYAAISDEVLYLLQSKLFFTSGFGRPMDSALAPFFLTYSGFLQHGRFTTQYPPGWPLLLAAFNEVGLRWFAPSVMGILAVVFTYLLGKELRSQAIGLFAASFLATSFMFVYVSSIYMSHAATLALTAAGAWLLVLAEGRSRFRYLLWALSGFVLGVSTMTRPLTGAVMAVSLWGWILLRGKVRGLDRSRMTLALALGAILPLGLLLYYNKTVTGKSLLFGYHVAHDGLQDLGFGKRGLLFYGPDGTPRTQVREFTGLVAARNFSRVLRDATIRFTPAFLLAPLVFVGLLHKFKFPWATVGVFLLLPLTHYFYYYVDLRFYLELLPFLFVGLALLLAELAQQNARVARVLIGFLLIGNVFFAAEGVREERQLFRSRYRPYLEAVNDLHREKGKLLVFVKEQSEVPALLAILSWFNVDSFPGDVIVARDLGPRNVTLMVRWPDYCPVRISDQGFLGASQHPALLALPHQDLPPAH